MVLKNICRFSFCIVFAFAGCKKSELPAPTAAPLTNSVATNAASSASTSSVPISRIHWLGKKKIAADTNSASLMAVWNLPESTRLEAQTLDKLSTNLLAPLSTNSPLQSPISYLQSPGHSLPASLRPLLEDIINEESYLAIRGETNEPKQFLFAIRLDAARAAVWETNIALLQSSISSDAAHPSSISQLLSSVRVGRASDWTILFAPEQNVSLTNALARIQSDHVPFAAGATNWLDADVAWNQIASVIHAPSSLISASLAPKVFLTFEGDGKNVITHAQFNFAAPPTIVVEPWNIPTNLISPIFSSFTVARGIKSFLESSPVWTNLNIGAAPNQYFGWAMPGTEMTTYFAVTSSNASNQISRIMDFTLQKVNPWFETNGTPATRTSKFQKSETYNGLEWKGIPFMAPFVKSVSLPNGDFITGGLFASMMNRSPLPPPLMQALNQSNLVYYDFETTGSRIESLLHITQFARMILNRPQLPPDCASVPWLQAIEPKLNESVSEGFMIAPDKCAFLRKSSIGLTAIELHLLVDWLESPDFPRGLHTTSAPMPTRRSLPHKTPATSPSAPTP